MLVQCYKWMKRILLWQLGISTRGYVSDMHTELASISQLVAKIETIDNDY